MKETLAKITYDTALWTMLSIGWLMETTGATAAQEKTHSLERKVRQLSTLALFGALFYWLVESRRC